MEPEGGSNYMHLLNYWATYVQVYLNWDNIQVASLLVVYANEQWWFSLHDGKNPLTDETDLNPKIITGNCPH